MVVTHACAVLKRSANALLISVVLCGASFAQGPSQAGLQPVPVEPVPVVKIALLQAPSQHKFSDKENRILFTTVAALNAADFAVTRNGLQNGSRELNPVTRLFSGSTVGLAVNFAGATAGSIGLSYLFHKTGHHRLERISSMINIGASTAALTYSATHRSCSAVIAAESPVQPKPWAARAFLMSEPR
jgi:hypothetical protein